MAATALMDLPGVQDRKIKSTAIHALVEVMGQGEWKNPELAAAIIIKKYKISETEVKDAAKSAYDIAYREEHNLVAARIAKRYDLGHEKVIEAAERPYLHYISKNDFVEAAKIAKELDLPAERISTAVGSALINSMRRRGYLEGYVGNPQDVIKKLDIPDETVKRIAEGVYADSINAKDFIHAANVAKDFNLDVEKQKYAVTLAYDWLADTRSSGYYSNDPNLAAARLAVKFELGEDKVHNATKAALIKQMSNNKYGEAAETAKEFGFGPDEINSIALTVYKYLRERDSISAFNIQMNC